LHQFDSELLLEPSLLLDLSEPLLLLLFTSLLPLNGLDVVSNCCDDLVELCDLLLVASLELVDLSLVVVFSLSKAFLVDHLQSVSVSLRSIVLILHILQIDLELIEQFLSRLLILFFKIFDLLNELIFNLCLVFVEIVILLLF